MYNFKNDYSEGAHPNIINKLLETNSKQTSSYGLDIYSFKAKELISKEIKNDLVDIHFVTGGTQANLVVLSAILRPHESVIAAETGHIAVHEAGAIESTGHKINTVKTINGKLTTNDIENVLRKHHGEHMVKPKLVFISNSTELGSVYKKEELSRLSAFCKNNNLFLYLDGARIGYALTSDENDLTLADITKYVDAFYIGGTKNGGMFGEAIILVNPKIQNEFRHILKQKGALISKSRFLGIQFLELFTNHLFFEIAKQGNLLAKQLADGIKRAGYNFFTEPATNMIFPILPNCLIEKLASNFEFYNWKKFDNDNSVIRLVTTWATDLNMINSFLEDLKIN